MSKKICLLLGSLSSGGAEKVAANMSISLKKRGCEIHVVSMRDEIDYKFEGQLYNFGKVKTKYGKLRAFFKFKKYFKDNQFDFIIDHRTRSNFFKELLFSKLVFQHSKVIYCVHSYHLEYYFSFLSLPWLSRLPHVKSSFFVAVCNAINDKLQELLNIKSTTIYNFVKFDGLLADSATDSNNLGNYIIGVGRFNKIKQFDKLIKAYSNSKLIEENVKLVLLGDGPEKVNLQRLIAKLKLEPYIKLFAFRKKPMALINKAKALVLSSKEEGFPMVLLEALTLKTPVIAFNCKSGPNEIIEHGINGLLVEDQNEDELSLALNKLLLDEKLYAEIKENLNKGIEKFSEEKVIQKWINFFESEM
ncbi:glycosyltransferase [Gaetbulibacter saemankumensis]|uniref:glycosyltransferase n=1 Tax=Gaetbulibacter saemankumensis TaxID=311208 RepID=UPI00041B4A46|nr:glycosyltransferase [Gaetbulibacter saemankumensis]